MRASPGCFCESFSNKTSSFRGVDEREISRSKQADETLLHHDQLRCHHRLHRSCRLAGHSLVNCFLSSALLLATHFLSALFWTGYMPERKCGGSSKRAKLAGEALFRDVLLICVTSNVQQWWYWASTILKEAALEFSDMSVGCCTCEVPEGAPAAPLPPPTTGRRI